MIFLIYGILALAFFCSHINVKDLSCLAATPYVALVHSAMIYVLQYYGKCVLCVEYMYSTKHGVKCFFFLVVFFGKGASR